MLGGLVVPPSPSPLPPAYLPLCLQSLASYQRRGAVRGVKTKTKVPFPQEPMDAIPWSGERIGVAACRRGRTRCSELPLRPRPSSSRVHNRRSPRRGSVYGPANGGSLLHRFRYLVIVQGRQLPLTLPKCSLRRSSPQAVAPLHSQARSSASSLSVSFPRQCALQKAFPVRAARWEAPRSQPRSCSYSYVQTHTRAGRARPVSAVFRPAKAPPALLSRTTPRRRTRPPGCPA